MTHERPGWDEYFMGIADKVAERATCGRGRSGCVIVKNNRILVTGYVGSPPGMFHCDEAGHQMIKVYKEDNNVCQVKNEIIYKQLGTEHCVRTIHAEQNAIIQAAKHGIALEGSTLYCRMTPCRVCAMFIVSVGIRSVVCEKKYHTGQESEEMFHKADIPISFFSDEIQEYEK